MATQWKRVHVSGKGYRWTDGNGNYREKNPSYRNPANDLVDGAGRQAGRAGNAAASTASRSASATATAASRTAERERQAQQNGIGLSARREREKPAAKPQPKPEAKPAAKPDWRSKVTQADPEKLSKQQNKTIKNHAGNKPQPKPQPKPAATPKPSGGGSNRPATTSKPSPQGSSSTSKTSSSRNVGPVANGDDYARNKDPKKHNPLMQKTFGYQKGDAPSQRAKRENYSGTDTGVSPKNTGSKNYADKKPDNKTTAAYDSGVNLNPAKPAKPASPNEPKKKPSETLAEAVRKRRNNRYA